MSEATDAEPSSKERKAAALARASLFEGLEQPDIDRLADLSKTSTYRSGDMIFQKGDLSRSLYVIDRGRVKISTDSPDGREVALNLLGPGDVFGEIALIDGGARTADAIACEPCRLLQLDRADLTPLLEREPALTMRMLVALTGRVRWIADRFEDSLFLDLGARLAKRLLFLGDHFGIDSPRGRRLSVSLPQRELAAHMGVSRETVNRLLQQWRASGLIMIDRGVLVLTNLEQLSKLAQPG